MVKVIIPFVAFFAFISACKKDTPVTKSESCKQVADTMCNRLDECNLLREGVSLDNCKVEIKSKWGCDREEPTVCANDGKRWSIDKGQGCISELKELSCKSFQEWLQDQRTLPNCDNICL